MRLLLAAGLSVAYTLAIPGAASAGSPQDLGATKVVPFQFRELHVGAPRPTGREKAKYLRCEKLMATMYCTFPFDMRIANLPVFGEARFAENGFSEMILTFSSATAGDVRSALVERYGAPCAKTEAEVQNAYGAKLTRETLSFCFSDGMAIYQSVGTKIDEGVFRFTSQAVLDALAKKSAPDF